MKVSYIATILLLVAAFVLGIVSLGGSAVPWGHMEFELYYACVPGDNGTCPAGSYCDTIDTICRVDPGGQPTPSDQYLIVNNGLARYYFCRQANLIEFSTSDSCYPDVPCGATCARSVQQVRAFTIIAVISTVCAMIAIVFRAKKGGRSFAVAGTLLVTIVFFAAAWGSWLGGCNEEMQHTSGLGWQIPSDFKLAGGFYISLVAWLLVIITSFLQLCVPSSTNNNQNVIPGRPAETPPQALSMDPTSSSAPAEKVQTEPPSETDPDSPDRPPRPSTSTTDPPPSSSSAARSDAEPVHGQVQGYTPTTLGKSLHFSSLGALIMALVCGILSISMKNLPWTAYDEGYTYTFGQTPPPPLDPDGSTIISTTLTGWAVCYYANEYSYSGADPSSCKNGGKVITGLMSIAVIFSFVSMILIYLRGRDKGINAGWLKIVSLVCFVIAMVFFLVSWALWMAPGQCFEAIEDEINQGNPPFVYFPFNLASGFDLAVAAFVAALVALIVHSVSICTELRGGTHQVQTDTHEGGYTSLLDSDVPYL